jgi:signal transduction histidine kinase
MLMAMPELATFVSPMTLVALVVLGKRGTVTELNRRLAAAGLEVDAAQAQRYASELEALGLIHLARGGRTPEYARTELGTRLLDDGAGSKASAPLQELERLRTDLLSIIAHELRTPITVMRTLTGLLLDAAAEPTPEQRRQMLQTMERNAERMQHLIGEILEMARYRSGTIRLQLRQFDAVELAASAIATIQPLAEQRGQSVELDAPANPLLIIGDRPRLDRALLNLAANAQRFAPDHGHITIRVSRLPRARVCWAVTDDGPGISAPDRRRLFERFFVGTRDARGARDGVGLGLPRALAIAQAHGGNIEVASRLGHGSTFKLIVPIAGPGDEGP